MHAVRPVPTVLIVTARTAENRLPGSGGRSSIAHHGTGEEVIRKRTYNSGRVVEHSCTLGEARERRAAIDRARLDLQRVRRPRAGSNLDDNLNGRHELGGTSWPKPVCTTASVAHLPSLR